MKWHIPGWLELPKFKLGGGEIYCVYIKGARLLRPRFKPSSGDVYCGSVRGSFIEWD
jgi:hypothetical protein